MKKKRSGHTRFITKPPTRFSVKIEVLDHKHIE
jgi:hypothetical protein